MLLAVLRLYLVFPEASKPGVVGTALLLALQQLPENDFSLCLHLVPERAQAEAEVAQLVTVASAAEACRFKDLWAAAAAGARTQTPGFTSAARRFVAHCLASTYRTLGVALALEALHFDSADQLRAWAADQPGWAVDAAGETISLPRTAGNDPAPAPKREAVSFAKLDALLKV